MTTSTRFTRPAGAFDSTSVTTNKDKYQDDSLASTAISSAKVDGDLNYLIESLNQLDDDIDALAVAGVADGDKGDITVSGSGLTWTIDANAISTTKIADDAVTYAKIQNVAGDYKLLGNVSGAGAAVAEISLLDEDTMSSDSATAVATQQSIKAYVDTATAGAITNLTPMFQATRSTTQAINATTWTTIQLGTEDLDSDSMYDNTTYKFTPTTAGWYWASLVIGASTAAADYSIVGISKNSSGNLIVQGEGLGDALGKATFACAGLVYLNGSTDFIFPEIYSQNAVNIAGYAPSNKFVAYLVKAD